MLVRHMLSRFLRGFGGSHNSFTTYMHDASNTQTTILTECARRGLTQSGP